MALIGTVALVQLEDSGNVIEGIGNEVVLSLLLITLIGGIVIKYFVSAVSRGELLQWEIHPSSADAVETARRFISNRFATTDGGDGSSGAATAANHQSQRHYGVDTQCPVCLGQPRLPIETNCGHLFCANCLIVYWRHGSWLGPVQCPVCRTQVSVMLTCFRLETPADADENELNERTQVLNEINQYNRRFSGEPRPWIDYLRELPTLLRHLISEFFTIGGLMYMLRIRIMICFLAAILYLISPLDLIPEGVFGLFGFLDDLFVALLLAIYVTMIYRRFLANRWTNED